MKLAEYNSEKPGIHPYILQLDGTIITNISFPPSDCLLESLATRRGVALVGGIVVVCLNLHLREIFSLTS